MEMELFSYLVPGGKLVYYLNQNQEAVLVDYIGIGEILIIPSTIPCGKGQGCEIEVATDIPDESFQSCSFVKYVVDFNGCNWGMFVFTNCPKATGLISIDTNSTTYSEFSFTDENYVPRKIPHYLLTSEDDNDGNIMAAQNLVKDRLIRCAEENDVDTLLRLVSYENVGKSLRTAIFKGDIATLRELDALGMLSKECPFVYSIGTAIKYRCEEVFIFLAKHNMYSVYWSEGSALFATVQYNNIEYAEVLLSQGYSPFALTPEWDGERSVLEYALENNRVDIGALIHQYQVRNTTEALDS